MRDDHVTDAREPRSCCREAPGAHTCGEHQERARSLRVLLVDVDAAHREPLAIALRSRGFEVTPRCDDRVESWVAALRPDHFGVAIVGIESFEADGITALRRLQELDPTLPVILRATSHSLASEKRALDSGALAFVGRSRGTDDVVRCVQSASRQQLEAYADSLEARVSTRDQELSDLRAALTDLEDERERVNNDRRRLEQQLRQSQKMEALGQLAGGVAHDFSNLLTVILGNLELLISPPEDHPRDQDQQTLQQIQNTAQQAVALTRQLLTFSRKETSVPEPLDPGAAFDQMQDLLRRLVSANIEFRVHKSRDLGEIYAESGQFEQIIMNLVLNATDAMPTGGVLELKLAGVVIDEGSQPDKLDAEPGSYLRLTVSDDGVGMSPEVLKHLYEPFFTTKPPGRGTGLGLASVYDTVQKLRGHITVESIPEEGSQFRVYIPVLSTEHSSSTHSHCTCEREKEVILLCEDDPLVRSVTAGALRRAGYEVFDTGSAAGALELAKRVGHSIDLLVTDVIMPDLNGKELTDRLLETCPGVRVLFMSGYSDDIVDAQGVGRSGRSFLRKPYRLVTLLKRVRELLGADHLGQLSAN